MRCLNRLNYYSTLGQPYANGNFTTTGGLNTTFVGTLQNDSYTNGCTLRGDFMERKAILSHYFKRNSLYSNPTLGRGMTNKEMMKQDEKDEDEEILKKRFDVSEAGHIIVDCEEKEFNEKCSKDDIPTPFQVSKYMKKAAEIQKKALKHRFPINNLQILSRKEFKEWEKALEEDNKEKKIEKKEKKAAAKRPRKALNVPMKKKSSAKMHYIDMLRSILLDEEGENLFPKDDLIWDDPRRFFHKRNVVTSLGVLKLNMKHREKAKLTKLRNPPLTPIRIRKKKCQPKKARRKKK